MALPFHLEPSTVAADQDRVVGFAQQLHAEKRVATYLDALDLIQRGAAPRGPGEPPALMFDLTEPRTAAILADFDPGVPDRRLELTTLTTSEQTRARAGIAEARALLARFDPRVVQVIDSLVGAWVLARSPGFAGGSFWYALGTVWLSPDDSWAAWDYAENMLHESTHQATFLSDMVHGLFSGDPVRLSQADALVHSPIRRAPRRYDFAFHAAMVAATLADFYEVLGRREKARALFSGLGPCLEELRDREGLLAERGLWMLTHLERYVGAVAARVATTPATAV